MKNKTKKRSKLWLYLPLWLLTLGMFAGLFAIQRSHHEGYRQELARLNAELAAERQVATDLRYRQAFYESDAYIERLAREMLGFVRQDEIVFQNIAD